MGHTSFARDYATEGSERQPRPGSIALMSILGAVRLIWKESGRLWYLVSAVVLGEDGRLEDPIYLRALRNREPHRHSGRDAFAPADREGDRSLTVTIGHAAQQTKVNALPALSTN